MPSLSLETEYPMEPFIWSSPAVQTFKLVILLTRSSSKLKSHCVTLGKSKSTLFVYFYWLWAGYSYFTDFGQNIGQRKSIKTLSVWEKIQEPHIGSGTSHFQWFK